MTSSRFAPKTGSGTPSAKGGAGTPGPGSKARRGRKAPQGGSSASPGGTAGGEAAGPWAVLMANVGALTQVLNEAEQALSGLGLDHKTLFLLTLLDQYDQPSALARALCTPRPTVTALVKRAEASGYLRREGVAGDLRRFRLSLTDKGQQAAAAGRRVLEGAFAARLAAVGPSDRAAYSRAVLAMASMGERP